MPPFYILHYRKQAAKRSLHRHFPTLTGAKVRRRNETTKLFRWKFHHGNKIPLSSTNEAKCWQHISPPMPARRWTKKKKPSFFRKQSVTLFNTSKKTLINTNTFSYYTQPNSMFRWYLKNLQKFWQNAYGERPKRLIHRKIIGSFIT